MLMDPLLVAMHVKRFPTFLTRSDVFKKGWIDKALRFLGLLPVYRMRDGYASLRRNKAIFDLSCERLQDNGVLLMFPEGSSDLRQHLRPLSKGFTRVVFHDLNKSPDMDLYIEPIGINYREVTKFPDSVSVIFGEPLRAQDYLEHGIHGELIEDVALLRADMQTALQQVVTSIPKEGYQETRNKLLAAKVDVLDPQYANDIINSGEIPHAQPGNLVKSSVGKLLKLILITAFFPVYLLWRKLRSGMQEPDYIDTFRFVFLAFIAPIYMLMLFLIMFYTLGSSTATSVIAILVFIELLYVKFF